MSAEFDKAFAELQLDGPGGRQAWLTDQGRRAVTAEIERLRGEGDKLEATVRSLVRSFAAIEVTSMRTQEEFFAACDAQDAAVRDARVYLAELAARKAERDTEAITLDGKGDE